MRIQSRHPLAARGPDAYFTPPEATKALLKLEKLPHLIWEPACGDGAITKVLIAAGHAVRSTDLYDYGWGESGVDYLAAPSWTAEAIVTNPPYILAEEFLSKALNDAPYVAFLLRTNFLESVSRLRMFRKFPPIRVWISSRRLPMMHRHGWNGPRNGSNVCYAWFIWERGYAGAPSIGWFDWREVVDR